MNVLTPPWIFPERLTSRSVREQPSRQSPIQSLKYYNTPGVFPPSARVDPKLKPQPRRPLHLWEYWKYAAFLAVKGNVDMFALLAVVRSAGFCDSHRTHQRRPLAQDLGTS
jgi:hypothetical protein